MRITAFAALALATVSAPAMAITVDGSLDAGYGSAKSTVATDPAAPTSNFGSPGNTATVGYDIYLTAADGRYYGFFAFDGPMLPFANLYFDLDRSNGNGSDLGFELGQSGARAFIPGRTGNVTISDYEFAVSGDNIEFSLNADYLTNQIAGLNYYDETEFGTGDPVVLRLSQSGSYSVAGGASYGDDRLGAVGLAGAVPEPATWAMLILGFFAAGAAMRGRKAQARMACA